MEDKYPHKYFISYSVLSLDGSLGFGNCCMNLEKPVRSHSDTQMIQDDIKARDNKIGDLVILSWQRFEE